MVRCYKKNYYRPQFIRDSFIDLCGEWDFLFDDNNEGEEKKYYLSFPKESLKIKVPYSYEVPKSNINDEKHHNVVWYRKNFFVDKLNGNRLIMNFEGVDYLSKVWINGNHVTNNIGGHHRFSIDITDFVKEDNNNEIIVECIDKMDTSQPRGKQRWLKESYGCWYVQTTGIWKPVWCEVVSKYRIENVKITPLFDEEKVKFEYIFENIIENLEIETEISFEGVLINKTRNYINRINTINIMDLRSNDFDFKVKIWGINQPNLYDVKFKVFVNNVLIDEVNCYFGLRKISSDEKGIKMNNNPIYQKLILAQNYWKDTGLSIPDEEAIINDLNAVKQAGFNGIRIHQKIEDERFLYYCDVMGILVWSEFPATYEYNDQAIENITYEWVKAIKQLYNHPSIITWVPFNESWGIPNVYDSQEQQNLTEAIYKLTKSIDNTRLVITNDGWEHTISDILTLHDYDSNSKKMKDRYANKIDEICDNKLAHGGYKFAYADKYQYRGEPIIVSEYGGLALQGSDGWGYNEKMLSIDSLIEKYRELTLAIKESKYISGYCYTQLTDTYQETNGLLDFNHKPKFNLEKIKEINEID